MNTLEIVRRHEARHRDSDSLLFNCASFTWNHTALCYEIEVRGHIVAQFLTINAVEVFCDRHNNRIAEAQS